MESFDKLTHEFVYAVFGNGKSLRFDSFESALSMEDASFFIQRHLTSESSTTYGNLHLKYHYSIFNHSKKTIHPTIGSFKILKMESFHNTATFAQVKSYTTFELLKDKTDLITFRILGFYDTGCEVLFETIKQIDLVGGIEAFSTQKDKKYRIDKNTITYDEFGNFA